MIIKNTVCENEVLVDTSIRSLALRRKCGQSEDEGLLVSELIDLIDDARVVMIGPIRQEILSGISSSSQFDDLIFSTITYPKDSCSSKCGIERRTVSLL